MFHGLDAEQAFQRIRFDPLHHAGEEVVAFLFVFNQRILLSVASEADAVAQVIHAEEVVFPMVVDDLEHEGLFQEAHQL